MLLILPSSPIARATWCTSAPTRSARLEISLMKLIFAARNAFDAYLMSSAVAMFVMTKGTSIK